MLRDVGLQAARRLLEKGHDDFWTLAVVLNSRGRWDCLVSHELDFVEGITDLCQNRLLDAPRHDDQAEYDTGAGYTVRELQRLVAAGEVFGAAVVINGFNDPLPEGEGPMHAVWVHVECLGEPPVRWGLPYDYEGQTPVWSELVEGGVPESFLFPNQAEPGATPDPAT